MSRIRSRQRSEVVEQTDTVHLRVPADPAYVAVVRTAAAGLGTRLDLTLDEIENLRIAVDEACSLLLTGDPRPGSTLEAAFEVGLVGSQTLSVTISGPAKALPQGQSFSWSVLRALTGDVIMGAGDDGSWIRLSHVVRAGQ